MKLKGKKVRVLVAFNDELNGATISKKYEGTYTDRVIEGNQVFMVLDNIRLINFAYVQLIEII